MKRIMILILLNAMLGSIAEAQGFSWAKRAGSWAYDYGYGVDMDNAGNIYIAGKYELNANFSGTVVPCQGNHDIYVAKYTPTGALAWVRTAGGYTGDYAHCVAVDDSYVYSSGEIEGSGNKITFVGSPLTLYPAGNNDIFITKYDLNGNLIWVRRAGGGGNDRGLGIAADNNGNIYVTGHYEGTATFGNTTITGWGDNDIFVAKWDAGGNFLWVRKAGGSQRDESRAIGVDNSGNVYICGLFKSTANFSGTNLSSTGYMDAFLAKYNTNGDLQWVKKIGSKWDDVAWSLTIDDAGKIFIAGEFNSSVNVGGIVLTTAGSGDIFVARYNASGNVEWAKRAGGNSLDRARGIGTNGNILYLTGQFGSTATFGSDTKTAVDQEDIFISALSNNGDFLWTSTAGGAEDAEEDLGYESGNAITGDANNNVYATGALLSGGIFGNTTLNPYSRTDIFLAKLINGSGGGGGGGPDPGTELIAANSSWKYLDNGTNQGTTWRSISFNDAGWKTGNAEFGYGDGDETTIVSYGPDQNNKYITTYFRKLFNIVNTSTISGLELNLIRDDGAVIYINGSEVKRNNMPGGNILYTTMASTAISSTESTWQLYNVGPSALINGTNVVAVEIHQTSKNSSDLSFNFKMRTVSGAKIEDPQQEYNTELISFTGEEKGNRIYLSWFTAQEENNHYFIIERGYDDENLNSIGVVMGAGNSKKQQFYSFVDSTFVPISKEMKGKLYYRLNLTDYDGRATYSPVISVDFKPLTDFSISGNPINFSLFPNPVNGTFTVSFSEAPGEKLLLVIYDVRGTLVTETVIRNEREQVDVSGFEPGIYMVGIKQEDEIIFSEKIIIQK